MTQRTERGFFLLIPSFRSSEWTEMNFLWDCWFLNIKYLCWETFCSFLLWQLASEHPCSCRGKSFILILHWVAVACDISYPAGSTTQDCTPAQALSAQRNIRHSVHPCCSSRSPWWLSTLSLWRAKIQLFFGCLVNDFIQDTINNS